MWSRSSADGERISHRDSMSRYASKNFLASVLRQELAVDEALQLLVCSLTTLDLEVLGRGRVDLDEQIRQQHVEVFQRALNVGGVEAQRLVQLLEDADEVDHEADLLLNALGVDVGPVHAGERLEQHVVAHRLVEVHRSTAAARRSRSAACR
jgi:hypothetical protein